MDKTFNSNDHDNCSDSLYRILKDCAHHKSTDSINDNFTVSIEEDTICDYFKMIAITDDTIASSSESFAINENLLEDGGRISLAYENLKSIPKNIAEKFATQTKFLDLSHNNFRNLSFLTFFKGLHTLILDRNPNLDDTTLPYLSNLKILWINNCNITSIPKWIYRIQTQCPNLQQLSMMGNPGACSLLNGFSTNENSNYRMFVFNILNNLKYLDGVPYTKKIINESPQKNIQKVYFEQTQSRSKGRHNMKNNFTELFRFKKMRQNYHSSSTS